MSVILLPILLIKDPYPQASGVVSKIGFNNINKFGLELMLRSSSVLSYLEMFADAAARCPPAEPPLTAIFSGFNDKDFEFDLIYLIADFVSSTD